MSIIVELKRLWAGYPGGYKSTVRGSDPEGRALPFRQPSDPNDIRSKLPALGHREYWYPALPDKDIGAGPQVLRMLGDDLVLFRGKDGQIKALLDACPHRGALLSLGDCHFDGFISCCYHGATFDGDGNCVAMLTEGPDSKAPGQMKAWAFPTVTVKGIVFIWMGKGDPVDPREDIPPEMFDEPHTLVRWSAQVFPCNWILVLENTNDAHNAFYVHRNCVEVLRSRIGGRPRTPLGYRTKVINNKTANYNAGSGGIAPTERYYYDENSHIPYQMYYPGVDGVWPKNRWRTLWAGYFERQAEKRRQRNQGRRDGLVEQQANLGSMRGQRIGNADDDWQGTRLPSISAKGTGGRTSFRSHRWAVPIERDMTRIVYVNIERYQEAPSVATRFYKGFTWPYRNWIHNFNFRWADVDVERTCRYDVPEYLTPTDSTVVSIRKVLTEYGRGVHTAAELKELEEKGVREEQLVDKRNAEIAITAHSAHADEIKEGLARFGVPVGTDGGGD
jgi:phenylpropionate dioxygenase-like ring-hydroxylating dioxygenase large terminal subunit